MDRQNEKKSAQGVPPGGKKEEQAAPRSGGGLRRWMALGLLLVAVLVVVVLTTMEDGNHFAGLRRWLMYGSGGETDSFYTFAADPANRYGMLGEDLLVAGPHNIRLVREDGTVLYDLPVSLASARLSVGKELACVCDVGGNTIYVLDSTGICRTMNTEGTLSYYTARMNGGDYLAVTEQKSGYKAAVSVYDPAGELLFHFDSHENYLSDAVVTPDGKQVAVVSLTARNGLFTSQILVYDLATAQQVSACALQDGLVLDLAVTEGRVLSLCDRRLAMTTLEGETLLDLPYGNLYLHGCALTGEDFCALLLGRYQAGNICRLTTYDLEGAEIASLELTEEVLDLSAAGKYLAVLYSDSLVLYTRDLQEYARLEGTDYAGQVQMQEDGTALVVAGSSAWRYLP